MSIQPLPLEGVRILALSQFGAGPFGTLVLADLGAEVIKIEDPAEGGDVARHVPPYRTEGDSLYFQCLNRNKKGMALNLRSPQGREVFHRLVAISDGIFNNLRGDLPSRMGLTYERLKEFNPKIVCCSLSGFGQTGPRSSEPGYDYLMQAYAGYMSLTGEPDGPPEKCGVSIIDHAAGLAAALGLMVGLFSAQRTGRGCEVDVALLDTAISMLTYFAVWNLNRGYAPQRFPDSSHQVLVPCQNFKTRDGYLVLFCAKEKFWRLLCEALEAPDLADDPRFRSFEDRLRNRDEVVGRVQEILLRRTTEQWLAQLRGKVPCAPVQDVAQALEDPQVRAREMIVEVSHPLFGTLRQVGTPIKIAGSSPRGQRPAPGLGADTDALLREYLGCTKEQIEALRRQGVVGSGPSPFQPEGESD